MVKSTNRKLNKLQIRKQLLVFKGWLSVVGWLDGAGSKLAERVVSFCGLRWANSRLFLEGILHIGKIFALTNKRKNKK